MWVRLAIVTAVMTVVCVWSCRPEEPPESPAAVARLPQIRPDYVGVVIPPNIAPLNFSVAEPGQAYLVKIHAASGDPVEVASKTGEIAIPQEPWSDLLRSNAGKELKVEVYVKTETGTWNRYQTISNPIAAEPIDPYLVYRYMMPSSYFPKQMQICQRSLESFDERVVLDTKSFGDGCAHCHTFVGNAPEKTLLGIRSTSFPSATVYAHDGQVEKIGAKFGYTAWHPSGRIATYSVNKVRQFYHTARTEIHDVVDLDSAIFYYDAEARKIKKTPALADRQRLETYPAWTPDGRYLYFCSAPLLWSDMETVPPRRYEEVKYDLMRISYDVDADQWGPLETMLSARETGLSILLPRISPDGKFLAFCMGAYGCFPIYQPTSDLYLMDLSTGTYRKAAANSPHADAWHSWSSNSRWLVFSSKRQGGLFTRPFISYVDADGRMHKPFALPQRDPSFYEACYRVYSVPELVTRPVPVDTNALVEAISSPAPGGVHAVTGASPETNNTAAYRTGQASVQ